MNEIRYPVYIISKGRSDKCLTAKYFIRDGVEFFLVIEKQEEEKYRANYPEAKILVLPFSNLGYGTPARNFCWEHSKESGAARHWIFDDNIRGFYRYHKGKRIPCDCKLAISVVEEFTDRYTNIAISGFNYYMFVVENRNPFAHNCHVYSALLIDNNIPFRWRLRYNEDTDLCLQVLTNGLCTISFNVFSANKIATMTMKGGNMDELYQKNGRYIMARSLEEMWPEYVKTKWRFGRPQHVVNWGVFKTPLIRRNDIDWDEIEKKKYDIKLKKIKEIKSERLKKYYNSYNEIQQGDN